ncbi:protein draper-like [Saccostrea cucullata]|uniref:protein draper-like n=1 Tax=Saccostrea cuccullata TaxID=36930 RepID=UPI002ED6B728
MSPKKECTLRLLFIIFLAGLESHGQDCGSKNGQRICCSGFWYEKKTNQCLKCPAGNYGHNCSEACPYPYFGELCELTCNCSVDLCHVGGGCFTGRSDSKLCRGTSGVTCCSNYWFNEENHECTECNPGYFGTNCMERCPFPLYGKLCNRSCNCSEDDCNYDTGCPLPNAKPNNKNSLGGKIPELGRKRIYFRVGACGIIVILTIFVILFAVFEFYQRRRGSSDEQMIHTDNEPTYQEITLNEENEGFLISEHFHCKQEASPNPPEIVTN